MIGNRESLDGASLGAPAKKRKGKNQIAGHTDKKWAATTRGGRYTAKDQKEGRGKAAQVTKVTGASTNSSGKNRSREERGRSTRNRKKWGRGCQDKEKRK